MIQARQQHTTHVIFDLDGVLLDTEPMYTEATQQVLAPFGLDFSWSLKQKMMGHQELEAATILVAELSLPLTAAEFLARRTSVLERLYPQAQLKPGARKLVSCLTRRGIPLAIATSCPRIAFEQKMVHHQWLRSVLTVIVSGDDPEIKHGKPGPDIYLITARRLGTTPETCLVFEDSPAGIQAAVAAGMSVVAVPDPRTSPGSIGDATLRINSLADFDCNDWFQLPRSGHVGV